MISEVVVVVVDVDVDVVVVEGCCHLTSSSGERHIKCFCDSLLYQIGIERKAKQDQV